MYSLIEYLPSDRLGVVDALTTQRPACTKKKGTVFRRSGTLSPAYCKVPNLLKVLTFELARNICDCRKRLQQKKPQMAGKSTRILGRNTMLMRRNFRNASSECWPIPYSKNKNPTQHCLDMFRSFSSAIAEPDGMVDHQEFGKWSNGGGLFHKSAFIDPSAVVRIGAVIHPKATLGANVCVGSGTVVGPNVTVGHSSRIGYNVSLNNCFIGDSCVIHSGVCIGQDGFGFFVDEQGNMRKKPQTLDVRIGNHVEIGANTCIDRGSWRDTTIGDYTKIDNLVQIGHNVVIGKYCMLCGQAGIAGSATIGDYVTLGGRAAIRDHVSIVSKVRLAANSCVTKDIKEPGDYGGFPAVPIQLWRRQIAAQRLHYKKDL